ncbi:AAA family ATPase [Streptomyces sp. NPDC014864]|uniref:AAA family ATPase n=1 Tax=Streptomyces sp. NPDC014864 TaxID=3364924 RepID=UPI0036F8E244
MSKAFAVPTAAREREPASSPASLPLVPLAFRRLEQVLARAERMALSPGRHGDEPWPAVTPGWEPILEQDRGWAWLRGACELTDLEMDLVLLALAPEVDSRYARLFHRLADGADGGRPTVGLALDLLARTPAERLAARSALGAGAPLLARRVLSLLPGTGAGVPPLTARLLALDEQIVDVLLAQTGLDRRLASCCRLRPPGAVPAPVDDALLRLVRDAWGRRPLRLYFHDPQGADRQRVAADLAGALGVPLLTVDAGRVAEPAGELLHLVFREAGLHGALLHVDGVDPPPGPALADLLAAHRGVVVLAGDRPWVPAREQPLGVLTVPFGRRDTDGRLAAWRNALAGYGGQARPDDLDALAARFRLDPRQIEDAALTALTAARLRDPEGPAPTREELFAAARAQTGHELTYATRRIRPACGWDDIVLPPEPLAQLHDLCDWTAHRHRVLDQWGFGRLMSRGRGVTALFAGPPGTGKTLAAEVVAHELGLDLYSVDLSMVVSKYIGETEKNLERIFTAAEDADAILFFDEAEALFGKRSDVRDAHDRYANIEIAYLLQRMERHEGTAILATNLRHHLDDAFTRRLQFVVEFPFPGDEERRRIWRLCLPPRAPHTTAVDLEGLAREHRLTGGSIRNIALHAAFLAAGRGVPIGMSELLTAAAREYRKAGRVPPADGSRSDREGP